MAAQTATRSTPAERLRLAELLGALSYALDITEGQPPGHCVRVCWIGMHVGRELGLSEAQLWELYYVLLLKDLGCSSNAARICELYLADDLTFKADFKLLDGSLSQALSFVMSHTGLKSGLAERFKAIVNILQNGGDIVQEMIETRCQRGAAIARQLRFSEEVAQGIAGLDEHWNGAGKPDGKAGAAIPIYSRIALLAQVVDVFHTEGGPAAALMETAKRSGGWFDPAVVDAFAQVSRDPTFWSALKAEDLEQRIFALEPGQQASDLDDDYLDDIAAAFGQVVDAKSPYTAGHSARVALYADLIGEALGLPPERRRWLRRAALLHDIGKLGVSNAILDKPGKLEPDEWATVQAHATHTFGILSRIDSFSELARVAAAHHEKLDGTGYPLGLREGEISLETRIISAADFFDAITADRPYRPAMSLHQAFAVMGKAVGPALDPVVFAVLKDVVTRLATESASA